MWTIPQDDYTSTEHPASTWSVTRQAYLDRGIGIDYWLSDKRIVRRTWQEHQAAEEAS